MTSALTVLFSLFYVALATSVISRQDTLIALTSDTGISNSGPGAGFLSAARSRAEQDEKQALFATAGMSPNRSSSVSFQYGETAGLQEDSTWTWLVNITNVDLSPLKITSIQGQYSTSVQFDLQWRGRGHLKDYLAAHSSSAGGGQESTLCASRWSYILPANVTSRYSAGSGGNCSSVLGTECAASLFSALRAGGPCVRSFNSSYSEGLPGCQDTFDVARGGQGATQNLGNSTRTFLNYNNESVVSGDPIYFVTHQPMPSSNLTNFGASQTYLNMLYLTGGGSETSEPALLCQVVTPPAASGASTAGHSLSKWLALAAAVIVGTVLWP